MSDIDASVVGPHPLVEQLADILTRAKYIFDHQRGGRYGYTASRSRGDRFAQSFPERLRGRVTQEQAIKVGPGVNGITLMLHDSGALVFVAKISRQPTGETEEQLDSVVGAMATLAKRDGGT